MGNWASNMHPRREALDSHREHGHMLVLGQDLIGRLELHMEKDICVRSLFVSDHHQSRIQRCAVGSDRRRVGDTNPRRIYIPRGFCPSTYLVLGQEGGIDLGRDVQQGVTET